MSSSAAQGWVAVVGGVLTAMLGMLKYFRFRSKSDRMAAVGTSFASTVEALASDNAIKRMAAAVLLRRFFDHRTEQGEADTPYFRETIEVIAGMLREPQPERLQKVLADGLRYAVDLTGADLQNCNLRNAYLGVKHRGDPRVTLEKADLFQADCTDASLKQVIANETVFYRAVLEGTVFEGANCERADFREARLSGAKFAGAVGIPAGVSELLDSNSIARSGALVRE